MSENTITCTHHIYTEKMCALKATLDCHRCIFNKTGEIMNDIVENGISDDLDGQRIRGQLKIIHQRDVSHQKTKN